MADNHFQFVTLPFGLSSALRVITILAQNSGHPGHRQESRGAVLFALPHWTPLLQGPLIGVQLGNTVAVTYINHQEGTKSH